MKKILCVNQPYEISDRTELVTETTRLNDKIFGGWMCCNVGTAAVKVNGYTLQPQEGLDFLNAVPVGSKWTSPIVIEITTPGGAVNITRLIATPVPIKVDEEDVE